MHAKERLGPPEEPAGRLVRARRTGVDAPLLMVDIDGVISLFGVSVQRVSDPRLEEGSFHSIEGIPHFLSATAAAYLLELSALFELVWASEVSRSSVGLALLASRAGEPQDRLGRGGSAARTLQDLALSRDARLPPK